MADRYDPSTFEAKWQKRWKDADLFLTREEPSRPKFYGADFFPYPSGAGLSVGHCRNYVPTDVLCRAKYMQGYNVLHPMGFDAFGLPAENEAIKQKSHPAPMIKRYAENYKRQMDLVGISYDWSRSFASSDPEYYKWTQWIFELLYKKGLAYRKMAAVNWDPVDKTVLADEEIIGGRAERSGALVEKKLIPQWFFKITAYAERLLNDLDDLDWPEGIKAQQRNWIGKSEGVQFRMPVVFLTDEEYERAWGRGASGVGREAKPMSDELEALKAELLEGGFKPEGDPNVAARANQLLGKAEDAAFRADKPIESESVAHAFEAASVKAGIEFNPRDRKLEFEVFTTRVDTVFGMTFCVLSPEHEVVDKIRAGVDPDHQKAIDQYREEAKAKTDTERTADDREKTGVFTGAYAKNPANGKPVPIWIADYVLAGYGTGAIMAVPGHDQRDFEFALKFGLDVIEVNEAPVESLSSGLYVSSDAPKSLRNASSILSANQIDLITAAINIFSQQHNDTDVPPSVRSAYSQLAKSLQIDLSPTTIQAFQTGISGSIEAWFMNHEEDRALLLAHNVRAKLDEVCQQLLVQVKPGIQSMNTSSTLSNEALYGAISTVISVWRLRISQWLRPSVSDGKDRVITNSGEYNGMSVPEAQFALGRWMEGLGIGERKTQYKLRDWLISRQRYWGCPIPVIHTKDGEEQLVPINALPVELPAVDNYEPSGDGSSPLAHIPEFVNTTDLDGRLGMRETDTMGGFACSSWYFLRFCDPHNSGKAWDIDRANYWMPVDCYVGGAEHAVMHLLYARFWTKVLFDEGLVKVKEPFARLQNQGQVLGNTPYRKPREGETLGVGEDGILISYAEAKEMPEDDLTWRWARMSKSKGNVVTPDDMVATHGADALRVYLLFVAPFTADVEWDNSGVSAAAKFLSRVFRFVEENKGTYATDWRDLIAFEELSDSAKAVRRATHKAIRDVTKDIDEFGFNTYISWMMKFLNSLGEVKGAADDRSYALALSEAIESMILLLAPAAPHSADELWQSIGKEGFTYQATWPKFDAALAEDNLRTIACQVNGKLRDTFEASAKATNEELEALGLASSKVQSFLEGLTIRKVIVIPGKLVNIVAN